MYVMSVIHDLFIINRARRARMYISHHLITKVHKITQFWPCVVTKIPKVRFSVWICDVVLSAHSASFWLNSASGNFRASSLHPTPTPFVRECRAGHPNAKHTRPSLRLPCPRQSGLSPGAIKFINSLFSLATGQCMRKYCGKKTIT